MHFTSIIKQLRERLITSSSTKDPMGRSFAPSDPASSDAASSCELTMGHELPPVLRDIYLIVANGGFGPGYGVMGLEGGFTDDLGRSAESLYSLFREPDPEDPEWKWSKSWLPFCHWGCGVYSVVDCVAPYPVIFVDPSVKDIGAPMLSIVVPHKPTVDAWLQDWLDGRDLWREVWG